MKNLRMALFSFVMMVVVVHAARVHVQAQAIRSLSRFGVNAIFDTDWGTVGRTWTKCQTFSQGLLCRELIVVADQVLEEKSIYVTGDGIYIAAVIDPIDGSVDVFEPYIPLITFQRSGSHRGRFTSLTALRMEEEVGIWSSDVQWVGYSSLVYKGKIYEGDRYSVRIQMSNGKVESLDYILDPTGVPIYLEREIWENKVSVGKDVLTNTLYQGLHRTMHDSGG